MIKRFILLCLIFFVWTGVAMSSYLEISDAGTTITVECSNDTLTWTVATNNAILMDGSNSLRAWIKDDDGDYYVYDEIMFYYGTSAGTGLAGNDYTINNITGNWNWYPLTSAMETNQSAVTTALQDTTMDGPTKGSWVDDLNIPANIGVDGFAADGAIHLEFDSNDEAKLTFDRTRYNQPVVIHDAGFQTGTAASPTEHLAMQLKLDQAYETTKVRDEVSDSDIGTLNGTPSFVSAIKGSGLELDADTKYLTLSSTEQSALGISYNKGTIICDLIPTENWTSNGPAWSSAYIAYASDSGHYIAVGFNVSGFVVRLKRNYADAILQYFKFPDGAVSPAYFKQGRKYTIHVAWDVSIPFASASINGNILATSGTPTLSAESTAINLSTLTIGSSDIRAVLDDLKWYDDCILPYGGGPFLTNDGTDYSKAHGDVTLFSEDGSSWDVGTGVIGDVDNSTGQLSFWVDPSSALSADETLVSFGTNFHVAWDHSDSDIVFTYGSGTTIRTTTSLTAGLDGKHFIKVGWTASGTITLEADGRAETPVSASTAPTLAGSITWSSSVGMTRKCITDDPNTPDNWSAMGAPRLLPLLEVTE